MRPSRSVRRDRRPGLTRCFPHHRDPLFLDPRNAPATRPARIGAARLTTISGSGDRSYRSFRRPPRAPASAARSRRLGVDWRSIVKATLLESRELSPEVRNFMFETPEVKELYFIPGQFVSFTEV